MKVVVSHRQTMPALGGMLVQRDSLTNLPCAISAMAATFLKNGTCQPCHDHIEIFSHWIFSIYIVTNTNDNLI